MKEYIKKFETAESADNYAITDIPFTTTISGETPQNIRCNTEGMKLVNDDGVVSVEEASNLITFTVVYCAQKSGAGSVTNTFIEQCESGTTIAEFINNSDYNTQIIDYNGSLNNKYSQNEFSSGSWFKGFFVEPISDLWGMARNHPEQHWLQPDYVFQNGATYYYYDYATCLLGDTKVTMADGSTKEIKDIELNDSVLSLDLTTGEQVVRKVIFTDASENKKSISWDEWEFSDGTIIKTTYRHEFYNVEAGKFKYLDEWNMGEHTYKLDGTTPELIKHTIHEEVVNHYKITLEGSNNFFANGLLTGDRYCNNLEINLQNVD